MSDPPSPIPHPKPSDHEDVSWALSTAEANWRRGDHADALKWLQRAAEAASEAGLDTRYLELAKASSELAGQIESSPRLPQPITPITPITDDPHPSGATLVQPMGVVLPEPGRKSGAPAGPPPLPATGRTAPPARASSPSPPRASTVPARPPAPAPAPRAPSKPSPSRVPAPMPSRPVVGASASKGSGNSEPPGAIGKNRGSRPVEPPPPAESGASMKALLGDRPITEQLRTVRNLDKMTHLAALTRSDETSSARRPDLRPHEPEDETQIMGPSSVAPLTEVHPTTTGEHDADAELESDDDLEPWPTQTSRRAAQAAKVEAERNASAAAAVSAGNLRDTALLLDPDAPQLATTQALRVVLYRTADGVRIAPAGTKIPAISIEAILVALDPSVDLTAWLK